MQIASIPPPVVNTPLAQQDVALKAAINVQAAPPLGQRAVAPTPKAERSNKSRNKDKEKNGNASDNKGGNRGNSINIKV